MDSELTIIIPTKNEADHIGKLLDSIKTQDYPGIKNVPIYIADADSTDGTRNLLQQYTGLYIRLTDGGLPDVGRNKAANLSNSELLLFIDADIVLTDISIISRAIELLKKGNLYCISARINYSGNLYSKFFGQVTNFLRYLSQFFKPAATTQFLLLSSEYFNKVGGFDERVIATGDFFFTRKIPRKFFRILDSSVLTTDRRLRKNGMLKFKFILLWNFIINNPQYYFKNRGYWDN